MNADFPLPVIGFAAYSGTGKTTLLEKLIPLLREQSLRVGIIKHAHHEFDIDHPGKDSYRLRHAGATQTLVASAKRWALINENAEPQTEPNLSHLLQKLDSNRLDLVLVEGFKHEPIPRIELHRQSLGKPLIYPQDSHVIALACDDEPQPKPAIPLLDINAPKQIAWFIIDYIQTSQSGRLHD